MASATGTLSLIGLMRQLVTADQHIILNAELRVTACSLESFALFGLQPGSLDESQQQLPLLPEWVDGWGSVTEAALATELGTRICIRAPASVAAASGAAPERLWVTAHIQRVTMPGNAVIVVLHWRHVDASAAVAPTAAERSARGSADASPESGGGGSEDGAEGDSIAGAASTRRNSASAASSAAGADAETATGAPPSARQPPSPPLLVMGTDPSPSALPPAISDAESEALGADSSALGAPAMTDASVGSLSAAPLLAPKPSALKQRRGGVAAGLGVAQRDEGGSSSRNPLGAPTSPNAPTTTTLPTVAVASSMHRLTAGAVGSRADAAEKAVSAAADKAAPVRKAGENDRGSYASSHMTRECRFCADVCWPGEAYPTLSSLSRLPPPLQTACGCRNASAASSVSALGRSCPA